MSFGYIVLTICQLPVFLAAIYSVFSYSKIKVEGKSLANYLIVTGFLYILSFVLFHASVTNIPILHFLVPARFVLLLLVYKDILKLYFPKRIFWGLAIGFVAFSVLNTIFHETLFVFNSLAMMVESIVLIALSFSTYIFLMDKRFSILLKHNMKAVALINSGVFLYYTSSLIVTYFGNYFIQVVPKEIGIYIWTTHSLLLEVMYICFFRALWKLNNM